MIVDLERKWLAQARCIGHNPEDFFPPAGAVSDDSDTEVGPKTQAAWDKAKKVCEGCPVWQQCARDSLGESDGVWGGLDPLERRHLRRTHSYRIREQVRREVREEYARLAYELHSNPRYTVSDVARLVGITRGTVAYLVKWYEEHLKSTEEETAPVQGTSGPVSSSLTAEFPSRPPEDGDGWVRYGTDVIQAHYLGETEDGAWLQMKGPLSGRKGADSRAWFKAEDVKLCRSMPKVIKHRAGGVSRIYGTRISTGAAAR